MSATNRERIRPYQPTGVDDILEHRKSLKQRIRAYQPGIVDALVQEGATLKSTQGLQGDWGASSSARAPSGRRASGSSPLTTVEGLLLVDQRRQTQLMQKQAEADAQQRQFRETRQRRLEEEAKRNDAAFQKDYEEVLAGLTQRSGIIGDTDFTLEHAAKVKGNKSRALHKEWTEQVYDVFQERLQAAVNERDPKAVEDRLRSQMDQYLQTANTKLGVFRDVIIEADYDPLAAQAATIRIPTGDIMDPVKRDVLKPQHERQLMGLSADNLPLGKVTLDNKQWGALAITATPYGHCVDKNGDYSAGAPTAATLAARESHIPLDHYTYPRSNAAAAAEVAKGKRILAVSHEEKQGRHGLYDVVQHSCQENPSVTGGDRWLEHKGKGAVPPPAARTTERFSDVVQQRVGDVYRPNRGVMGDSWLDAKGKTKLPGPEVARGRPDLFPIVQQTGSRGITGARVDGTGDIWLETKGKRSHSAPPGNDLGHTVLTSIPQPLEPVRQRDPRLYMSHLQPEGGSLSTCK